MELKQKESIVSRLFGFGKKKDPELEGAAPEETGFARTEDAPEPEDARVTIPEHLGGWNAVTHGGVVSTILDETMSWAAMVLLKRLSFTRKMTVEFLKTVAVGATMEAGRNPWE